MNKWHESRFYCVRHLEEILEKKVGRIRVNHEHENPNYVQTNCYILHYFSSACVAFTYSFSPTQSLPDEQSSVTTAVNLIRCVYTSHNEFNMRTHSWI